MKRRSLVLIFLCWAAVLAAQHRPIQIPAISGPLTIDGRLDEVAWQGAPVLTLASSEFSAPFPAGGQARIAVRGDYLCLSASMPEPDRLVARSTGRNPAWWPEDLIQWTFKVHSDASRRNMTASLAVNPLGAWRLQNTATLEVLEWSDKVLAAANRDAERWTVEAAIPLNQLAPAGLIDIERVRVARPSAPELHWYWPAPNEPTVFELARGSAEQPPAHRPEHWPDDTLQPQAKRTSVLAWVPTAWTAEQREQLRTSKMLENSLRARMAKIAEQEKLAWQRVNSREDWEQFRDPRIAALRESMTPFPERTPLRPVVTRRADYGDGFTIENIVYESRPQLLVTANLYLPANLTESVPAIIVAHAHHAPKTQSELQDLGMTWARSGTAVLVPDQLCAGERSQSQPWNRESYYGRYTLGNQLLLAGESLMKWMVWDLMRSVDLLLERPYVDPKRIVMLGGVAGGGDPAAVTAALDPRIAAVIPFNFGEAGPEEHYTLGPRGYDFDTAWPGWGEWETTRCMPRSSIDQFFPWLICASVAPRPFLYSFEIGWPQTVEQEPMWSRYKKVFDLYGVRDRLDEVHGFGPYPGPGECTNVGAFLRRPIYPILNRWLGMAIPPTEYHKRRPEAELMCLTPVVAGERNPKLASAIAFELARARLSAARSRIRPADGEQGRKKLRDALKEKLGDIEPPARPVVQRLWSKSDEHTAAEAVAIEVESGITLPVIVLKPLQAAMARMPAVLAVTEGGKGTFLSKRGDELRSLLEKGVAVCLPDLRGMGELADTESRGPNDMSLAATEFMLGDTLLGARLKDVRTVLRYLAARPDIDAARISLWGDSFAEVNPDDFRFDQSYLQEPGPFVQRQAEPLGGLLALLTGLYEDRIAAVAARGGLFSFLSVLEDRFSHTPQDVIVPGILNAADVPDLIAAQGSKPLLIEGLVDARNKLIANERLQSEFGSGSGTVIVRRTSGEPSLVAWLVSRR